MTTKTPVTTARITVQMTTRAGTFSTETGSALRSWSDTELFTKAITVRLAPTMSIGNSAIPLSMLLKLFALNVMPTARSKPILLWFSLLPNTCK